MDTLYEDMGLDLCGPLPRVSSQCEDVVLSFSQFKNGHVIQ